MTQLFAKFVAVVAFTLGLSAVQAAPIFLSFEGRFTSLNTEFANVGLNIGDRLFGGVIFDSNTPDLFPMNHPHDELGGHGEYSALFGFVTVPALDTHLTFGGPENSLRVRVENDIQPQQSGMPVAFDGFSVNFNSRLPDDISTIRYFGFRGLADAGLFANDSLPTTLPGIHEFDVQNLLFGLFDLSPNDIAASGQITSWAMINSTERPLPEPGTVALLSLGLVGLAVIRRRKQ